MSQLAQICSYQGHEANKVKYICLDTKCQLRRLFCSQCMLDNLHKHDYENNKHIVEHKGLQVYIKLQMDQLQKQIQQVDELFVQRCITIIKKIFFQLNNILDTLKYQTKHYIENNILSLQNQLEQVRQTKLSQIDDKFINELINVDFFSSKQYITQQISQQCNFLVQNINCIQQLPQQYALSDTLIKKVKSVEYESAQLDQMNDQDIYTTTISNDMKYIVSSRDDFLLKIWNYLDYQLIQSSNLNDRVQITKFTEDSKLLYIGTGQGLLCSYDTQNNFRQTYKKKIHLNNILNLFCITNHIILTSSFDQRIIKTNTKLNQELLVIKAHDDRIDGLDYHRSKDIIASCSKDNFIKLWNNQNGNLLMKQQNAYQSIINQVLFIYNNDQLVSLDSKANINVWKIKFETLELQKINTINDKNIIFNISLVLNQQFILLVCKEQLKFYTIYGEYINSISHNIKEFYMIRGVQLDSLKSIIIQGRNNDSKIENLIVLNYLLCNCYIQVDLYSFLFYCFSDKLI